MNIRTPLYYVLSGFKYYKLIESKKYFSEIKEVCDDEIKYFFNKRYFRNESWYLRYMHILASVFTVNLLSRYFERFLKQKCYFLDRKYTIFAHATFYALKSYNDNRKFFKIEINREIFISDMIYKINEKVKKFFWELPGTINYVDFVFGNTPIGVELEFSNIGRDAGKFFVSDKGDPLLNFSKYHHYHLKKFLWRFGAYIDAEMPLKQFIKKGGFLEYTFTRPDSTLESSIPLTSSAQFAAELIKEAVRFTPIKPHSLHVTLESPIIDYRKPLIGFEESIFILLCTGQYLINESKVVESRIMEKNMKDIFMSRKRKNNGKWVDTVEFSNMRLCRDFVARGVYEPSINVFIAFKNMFRFEDILPFSLKIQKWGEKPDCKIVDRDKMFNLLEKGLNIEKSLPISYKNNIIERIKEIYNYNCALIGSING
jgi:hypothetical protein